MAKSRASVFTLCFTVLCISAGACHRQSPQAAAAPSPHPLALAVPEGASPADRAIADLQARLRRDPRSPETWVELGRAWVRKARESSNPGHYRSAADAADAALELAPGDRRATALRGLVLLDAHRFDEARRLAAELLDRDAGDLSALGILSDALLELGRFEEASAAAQRMVDLKPSLPAYARASHLLWLQADVEGALEAARLAVDAAGESEPRAWVLVQAAMILWHRGDVTGADAELDRALSFMPGYAPALAAKGRVALSRADFRAGASWLERAFGAAPLAETAWLLGDARQGLGDERGAREAYGQVVRAGQSDRRTLALFYATKGQEPALALRLAEAERAQRGDAYTEDALAWALFRAGRLEEARAASDRARRLGTPDARLLYHAGAIRVAMGDGRAGRELVRAGLRMNPGFDVSGAAEARRLLAAPRGGEVVRTPRRLASAGSLP